MQRFILRQNIERFEQLLKVADERTCERLETLLAETRRELQYQENIWTWTCPDLAIPDHLGAFAQGLLDKVVEDHGASFASLQVWDAASDSLRLIGHVNFDRASAEGFASVRNGQGTVCEAAQVRKQRIALQDVETAAAFASLRDWTRSMGIRAIQTTPLFSRTGRFVGAFSTHFATPRVFSRSDDAICDRYASHLGELLSMVSRP